MTHKKLIFSVLVLLFVIGLSAVNATDTQTDNTTSNINTDFTSTENTDTFTENMAQETKLAQETPVKRINKTKQTNTKESSHSVNNYDDLYNTLTNEESDETVTVSLDGDEKYTITNRIIVNKNIKNLTINGNGRIIDGDGLHTFLYINQSCNLVVNNVTIQNCLEKQTVTDNDMLQIIMYDGVIQLNQGTVLLNNTHLLNNQATGLTVFPLGLDANNAFFNENPEYTSNVTILNSEFNNNKGYESSAILYVGTKGSSFYMNNTMITSNGKKDNNISISGAVAIETNGNIKIENSEFNSNYAAEVSSALVIINFNNNTSINNCSFKSNKINKSDEEESGRARADGAVSIQSFGYVDINNTVFESNSAKSYSALVLQGYGVNNITNSKFLNNAAKTSGTIGYYSLTRDEVEHLPEEINIILVDEAALNIDNSTFEKNRAESVNSDETGGAIYAEYANVNINNTRFTGNTLNSSLSYGGAIYVNNTNLTVNNSYFSSNYAINGGAICYNDDEGSKLIIDNTTFEKNAVNDKGETIAFGGALYIETNGNTTITGSTFKENHADYTGIIYYDTENENSNLLINGTKFDSNGNTNALDAAVLSIVKSYNTVINNSEFTSNTGAYGAIMASNMGSLIVENTLFESNKAVYYAGALNTFNNGNMTLANNTYRENWGDDAAAVDYYGFVNTTLKVIGTEFDSNGGYDETLGVTSATGAMRIETLGEAEILGSNFHDNFGDNEGVLSYKGYTFINRTLNDTVYDKRYIYYLYYEYKDYTNLTIKDTNFTSNKGTNTTTLVLYDGNVTLDNVNFYNNTLKSVNNKYTGQGLVICSNSTLSINNSNFEGNGLPADLDYSTANISETYASVIWQMKNNMIINNSNFTSNLGGLYGAVIIADNGPIGPTEVSLEDYIRTIILNHQVKSTTIDNTIIENNKAIVKEVSVEEWSGEKILINLAPGILNSFGHLIVNHSQFISNKVENLVGEEYDIKIDYGVISFEHGESGNDYQGHTPYRCDVTNNEFYDNDPSNFIVKNSQIVIRNSTNPWSDDIRFDDGYIPTFGNATIYLNDETQGKQDNLTSDIEVIHYDWSESDIINIRNTRIENPIDEKTFTCRVVIDQNESSKYYDTQTFYNNTYYFVMPHDYILTVNATSPVELSNTTTIKGRAYFNTSNGEIVTLNNQDIELYIDGEYINSTQTNNNGEYEFTYTTKALGTHNVTVQINKTKTSPLLSNKTTFDVNIKTHIILDCNDTLIGQATIIHGTLKDIQDNIMPHTDLVIFVDNEEYDVKTDENGEFSFSYVPTNLGNNYVIALFAGNTTHLTSENDTIFHATKINTTTTATTPETIDGKVTFNVEVNGKDGKKITSGTLIIYDEEGEIVTAQKIKDTTTVSISTLPSGTYTLNVTYIGNDTYNPSSTTTRITIKPEAQISIDVLNDTEGNVQVEVTVTDDNGEALPGQTVEITLPDGTKSNKTTNSEGKIIITDTTTPPGNAKITATIPSDKKIIGDSQTKAFTIEPDYPKIIDEMNKTSVITAIPENGSVDDNKVTVTIDNKLGTPISNAPITITNSKGEKIGNATTDENGVAIIPVKTKAGTEKITVTYPGNNNYKPASTTVSITTTKNNVTVTVDPVNGIIGENIILTAHVLDTKGNPVNGGNLVFKLNGKTLRNDGRFDSNAPVMKFKVENGIVTATINADLYLRNTKNITASYSGTYKYEEAKSSTVTAQIKKRNAKITVTTSPRTQKQYNTIKFTAKLTDTTPNTKNKTAMSTATKVIFKVNGKTIKDNKGKNVQVKVVNNTATYKYTVPAGMGGVNNDGTIRDYDVEAVLVSDTYYPDTRDTGVFHVERSPVTINIAKTSVNSKNVLSVQATIKDYKGKNVIGTNQVNIKINGRSYVNPSTGKTQNFQVTDGKINLKNIQLDKTIKVKSVMIVTGDRQAYLGARNETSKIVKV
ncbi:Ig-like domain repeat protein [Methanosphaera sp. ISO3-F5]|uniref:Ig-like domain-containing protein n=1 Tax=Methanosphaera sp. ISO3-F5 TaxID=1452353 RepID=UPI002B25E27B|nr:Ig-like domain repeat protein [Methanosphaera sp. ISO3-F5]WQH64368.1 Ig-like domain repeat protein [Methanosphaera sp. ISO3-F5]